MAVMTTTFLSSYWVGLAVGGAIGAVLALILAVILFLPDGILGTLQKKFNFEILSQKRLSDVKEKKVRLGKKN